MLIVCPSCASEYMIDPARLGSDGRTVRCASCRATWFVAPEPEAAEEIATVDEPAALEAAASEAESEPDPATAESAEEAVKSAATVKREEGDEAEQFLKSLRKGRSERRAAAGVAGRARSLAACLAIVAALLAAVAAVFGRAHVVQAFPGAAPLYARLGLPVNLRGFDFRGVKSELVTVGAEAFLVVEGDIANVSGRSATVPPIEVRVRGAEGQMLYTWTTDPPRSVMDAGETAHFRARLASPPAEARQVLVLFAASSDSAALASRNR